MDTVARAMQAQVRDAAAMCRAASQEQLQSWAARDTNLGVIAAGELRRREARWDVAFREVPSDA